MCTTAPRLHPYWHSDSYRCRYDPSHYRLITTNNPPRHLYRVVRCYRQIYHENLKSQQIKINDHVMKLRYVRFE